jgi:ribose 5-phosphate isomerase B
VCVGRDARYDAAMRPVASSSKARRRRSRRAASSRRLGRRVALGADHAGFDLKRVLGNALRARGCVVADLGTHSRATTDYPPFCLAVGEAVASGRADWGIVLGGSGQGEQIAANKVRGIRAALCHDPHMAELARRHNNANVLAMGGRIVAAALAIDIVDVFRATSFEAGRHVRRLEQIRDYEDEGLP